MIGCLVLLGLANILGAMSSLFSLLFATRILTGIGSGGVFPIALGLTSDPVEHGYKTCARAKIATVCAPAVQDFRVGPPGIIFRSDRDNLEQNKRANVAAIEAILVGE